MRILHLGKYYSPERGGIESSTQALAEYCVGQGDAVAALVHARPGVWRSTRETINDVEVRRVGCIAAPVYTPVAPAYPLQLARALRELRPDILHLHFPNPACFAALALPAARRIPWIVHWHADVPPDSADWRLRHAYRAYRPFEQAVLRRSYAVIATSAAYRDASVALAPWRAKTRIVALGIAPLASPSGVGGNDEMFGPRRDGDGLRVLAVGRLSAYKGFDVLIDALTRLPDARSLLVGAGECDAALRARAIERGIAERIRFAGALDDAALASAYAGADVFVLPSRDRGEAFGLVLLEAMRAGLPVVASDIAGSGIGSVVDNGETGWLVPVEDADALAAAIATLRDADLRRRFGANGRARFLTDFTLAKSAACVSAIYREALASGNL